MPTNETTGIVEQGLLITEQLKSFKVSAAAVSAVLEEYSTYLVK
jgi:hypothetical protein